MSTAEDILNRAITLGNEKADRAEELLDDAVTASLGAARVTPQEPAPTPAIVEPPVTIPMNATGVDSALFNSTYDRIIHDLSDKFAQFLTEFFPVNAGLMNAVEAWLNRAITTGGTGVNADVERQIWQRDRDRITAEANSAGQEAVASWAAKGYPLPPGAAVAAVQEIQRKRTSELNAQSREVALNMFKVEIENVRFAVKTAIDYRTSAIAAAGDYIKAMALGPQLATQLATTASDAQARLISAASTYYNARISVAQLAQQKNLQFADNKLRAALQESQNIVSYSQLRTNAALGAAQSLGQQASAALNSVSATAQLIQAVS